MTRILVTGAGGSAAYNFCDALRLSNKDLYVVGTDIKPYHLELLPADKKYLVPGVNDPEYLTAINKIIEKEQIEFLHPQPDVEVAFWAKNRDKVNAKIFLPANDEVELCHDKMEFNKVLKAKNVAVPEAFHVASKESLESGLSDLLSRFPKVWIRAIRGAGSRASLPVDSVYQADAWINYWQHFKGLDYPDFMVSEFLPGHEYAWQSLWWEGELVTAQARERIEYIFGNLTPSGQTSSPSVAKTVNRSDIDEVGQAAVRAASGRPHGVYCVDMKEGADGVPKVTEINIGRFFTTSNFFAHAGLNMPAMYLELGLTGQLQDKPRQLNPLSDDLYWVRMIDMGFKLVKGGSWMSNRV